MNVLLLNPPFSYRTPWLVVTEPLGVLYLASYIRKYSGHKVSILDCISNSRIKRINSQQYWYGLGMEEILRDIESINPDIIGITCSFSRKKDVFLRCALAIKEKFPHILLVGGGTYPSLSPNDLMANKLFDYCIIGEGEQSFLDLLNMIAANDNAKGSIDGLAFLNDGKIAINPKRSYIEKLDQIPFPARDLINYEGYAARKTVLYGLGVKKTATILTSRSCPNRCNFCSMFKIHGPRWRGRTAKNVVDEIIELNKRYNVEDFFIMDDNFTFQRDRVMEICDGILSAGLKIRWNTPSGLNINTIDRELLKTMKASGCKSICVAIETGDEELRNKVIGKHLNDSTIVKVLRDARRLDMYTVAFYIIGMPGETEEKFKKTLKQLRELPLNGVFMSFANPLPGTKLYEDCAKNKWTILDNVKEKDSIIYKPYISTEDFSEKDLLMREKRFHRTFLRAKFFTIVKDTLFFRNKLLHPYLLIKVFFTKVLKK